MNIVNQKNVLKHNEAEHFPGLAVLQESSTVEVFVWVYVQDADLRAGEEEWVVCRTAAHTVHPHGVSYRGLISIHKKKKEQRKHRY